MEFTAMYRRLFTDPDPCLLAPGPRTLACGHAGFGNEPCDRRSAFRLPNSAFAPFCTLHFYFFICHCHLPTFLTFAVPLYRCSFGPVELVLKLMCACSPAPAVGGAAKR